METFLNRDNNEEEDEMDKPNKRVELEGEKSKIF